METKSVLRKLSSVYRLLLFSVILLSFFSCQHEKSNLSPEAIKIRWDKNPDVQKYLTLNSEYINFLLSNFQGKDSDDKIVKLMLLGQEIAAKNSSPKTEEEKLALKYYELTITRSEQAQIAKKSDNQINFQKDLWYQYIAENSPMPTHSLE